MADEPSAGGMPATNEPGETPNSGEMPLTFDSWLETQDDNIKTLIGDHTSGLKSALQTERQQRTELAKALKDATKDLEEGSKARDALDGLSAKLDAHEQQLAFYETATAAGVTNLKLAWIAAREAGAIDKRGNVNIETLKADYPELFKQKSPPITPGNGGNGAGGSGLPSMKNMDNFIRAATGRR